VDSAGDVVWNPLTGENALVESTEESAGARIVADLRSKRVVRPRRRTRPRPLQRARIHQRAGKAIAAASTRRRTRPRRSASAACPKESCVRGSAS